MNVAYYLLVFDHATDALLDHVGLDAVYRERQRCSIFTLEAHISYLQELHLDDPLRCTVQLLDYDSKRIHFFQQLYHADDAYLAATCEFMLLHVAMTTRRSAPLRPEPLARLEALMAEHRQLARPPQVGATIGLRREKIRREKK